MPKTRRPRIAGFSMVELLVALVFISLLMAGMLRIYGSAIQGFSAANESVKAQRDNRVAMQGIEDDLSQVGYQFPYVTSATALNINTGGQNPMMLLPGQTITVKDVNQADATAAPTSETITFDELQITTDQPLSVAAHLTAVPTSSGAVDLEFTEGSFADLQAGDMIVLLDAQLRDAYDSAVVASTVPTSGTSGTLPLSSASTQNANSGGFGGGGGGLTRLDHAINADIIFIRPAQVIRYTLLPLALDPANSAATVACLVRDQKAYPSDGSLIAWPASTATAAQLTAAGVTRTLVAENVTALRFDISADQGTTWNRAASWSATLTNLNTALGTLSTNNPGQGYVSSAQDSSKPEWYRYAPMLFRVDITTRTALKRVDFSSTANTSSYRTRTQTLLVQPRNFGLGI